MLGTFISILCAKSAKLAALSIGEPLRISANILAVVLFAAVIMSIPNGVEGWSLSDRSSNLQVGQVECLLSHSFMGSGLKMCPQPLIFITGVLLSK